MGVINLSKHILLFSRKVMLIMQAAACFSHIILQHCNRPRTDQNQWSHFRRFSALMLWGVMLILSALSTSQLLKSGEETSPSKAFLVESLVSLSHSSLEIFLRSCVEWNIEGYTSSSCVNELRC